MHFTAAETANARRLIEWALAEDLGPAGDLTSEATLPADREGRVRFVARAPGVVAGLPAVRLVLEAVDSSLVFEPVVADGETVHSGQVLARAEGRMRSLLRAERTALNFLQHLTGIATRTRRYVEAVAGFPCQILDTRKTLPGWRLLAKYAVRCGGGHNHRMGLWDGVLIKDNHLAALGSEPRAITRAIEAARRRVGQSIPIEVEVDSLAQLDEALAARPDIVLLDNMDPQELHSAVERRNERAPGVLLEASGGVRLDTVRAIAAAGVDRISVGELTHSAPALDIGLDYVVSGE
jgi:nicotinate-nucleotide pyrophosphorylase (carboxylating)